MRVRKTLVLLTAAFVILSGYVFPYTAAAEGEESSLSKIAIGTVKPDTWTAVDGLGRTVNTYSETGEARGGQVCGIILLDLALPAVPI